jgi:hypothetical protein
MGSAGGGSQSRSSTARSAEWVTCSPYTSHGDVAYANPDLDQVRTNLHVCTSSDRFQDCTIFNVFALSGSFSDLLSASAKPSDG